MAWDIKYLPPPPPAAGAPAYFTSQTEKTWVAKAGSAGQRITDVTPSNPGQGSAIAVCSAFTGGCVDQVRRELLLAANGGHTDYGGNEVYAFGAGLETPIWIRLTNPSAVDTNDSDSDSGGYPDGKIRSSHGYGRQVWGDGKIWHQPEGQYINGSRNTHQWKFDRDSLGSGPFPVSSSSAPWTNLGESLPTKGGNIETQGGPSAYDRVNNRVWNIAHQGENSNDQSIWSTNCATGAFTQHNLRLGAFGNGFPTWAVVAHDLNLLIIACSQGFLLLVDISTISPSTMTQKTPTGSPDAYDQGVGAVYHQPSRSVLCWFGYGTSIRKLKIPSNPISGTWTWSNVTAAGGGATPTSAPAAGTFGKFNIIEDMGNGQSALVVVNSISEATYVYKLPAGEVS